MLMPTTTPRIIHETSGLLFIDKPPGLSFHRSEEEDDPGLLPILRAMQAAGDIEHEGKLFSVHRLDRVTSGLLMIAKTADAAREVADVLRRREIDKYYVALSSRKPNKKQGRVSGDMARSRRGQWKLLRSTEQPAQTAFISKPLVFDAEEEEGDEAARYPPRAFLLKPLTGKTHQLRVALKALSSPVLGDPMYAAADDSRNEERAYLHAAALRLPAGCTALSEDGAPIDVVLRPSVGARFHTAAFDRQWRSWFDDKPISMTASSGVSVWFAGTPVASRMGMPHERSAPPAK